MRKKNVEVEGCSTCNQIKPPEEYPVKREGRSTTCKECNRKYQQKYRKDYAEEVSLERKLYYAENKHSIRNRRLEKAYGLPAGSYDKMLLAQDGKCGICGTIECGGGKDYFCVDHNHTTGKIRKLLCSSCNKMIGFARENPEILRQGALYIEQES